MQIDFLMAVGRLFQQFVKQNSYYGNPWVIHCSLGIKHTCKVTQYFFEEKLKIAIMSFRGMKSFPVKLRS